MLRRRGLTLVEAIIAIFLLLAGFIVVIRCFHSALRISAVTSTRVLAIQVGQRHLESIRSWSRMAHEPRGNRLMTAAWGSLDGTTYHTDSYDPRFRIATIISAPPFYSPCTLFEQVIANGPPSGPLDPVRTPTDFTRSRRQVTDVVNWGGSESVRLSTFICAPTPLVVQHPGRPRALAINLLRRVALWSMSSQVVSFRRPWRRIYTSLLAPWLIALPLLPLPAPVGQPPFNATTTVAPAGPVTLSHDAAANFEADFINNGVSLPCRVRWSVLGPGTGTLLVASDGRSARFIHSYDDNGLLSYADNLTCQLEVTVVYRGLIVKGRSGLISLVP